jgi:hypothetical protein
MHSLAERSEPEPMINRKWIRITAVVVAAAMLISTVVASVGWLFY